ncbi:MAG: hypothetical protein HYZ86_01515 [Candidatus Omnitrophica bacterium]|nr:hypothetical protein [Candidatus Omnitrophota bacterium]
MSNDKSQPLRAYRPVGPEASHAHWSILRSSGIVASGVLASRFLGFIRDVVIAHFMGTGLLAEAFFVAQRIPNLLRDLVGEGAANAAIVPVLCEYSQKKSRAEWQELVNAVMAWGVIILGVITVAGMVAAPWIVRLMAPGFMGDAAKFQLTVDLTRIMFPYLVLIALTAFQVGILYTLQSPCLLNVAMIVSVWAACLFSWHLAYALSVGVLVGGVLQLGAQGLALKKQGVHYVRPKTLNNEGVKKIWSLLAPRALGSGVYQLNVFADTFCASLAAIVGAGGIAAIYGPCPVGAGHGALGRGDHPSCLPARFI